MTELPDYADLPPAAGGGRSGRGLKAESPTQEMLRDVPIVLNVVVWIIVIVAIVYRLRPSAP